MTLRAVVVDYGVGNVHSATQALARACAAREESWSASLTADSEAVARADAAVLPGVGAFGACMDALAGADGLLEALDERKRRGALTLGICVGLQLFADVGEEGGERAGLGWIPGRARKLARPEGGRLPHMGWNALSARDHPLLAGLDGRMMYFANAYALAADDESDVLAWTRYGERFASVCARDSAAGVQFHPEKSQRAGLRLLMNFLGWRP